MKTEKFDIAKLIEDLTESEKLSLYGFIIGLKEKREAESGLTEER